jgi:hypothetical protein
MRFFIANLFGVVDAAIQGDVDCEDYVSHLLVLPRIYIREESGGRGRDRTGDPLLAKQVLSQLSYTPTVKPFWVKRLKSSSIEGLRHINDLMTSRLAPAKSA